MEYFILRRHFWRVHKLKLFTFIIVFVVLVSIFFVYVLWFRSICLYRICFEMHWNQEFQSTNSKISFRIQNSDQCSNDILYHLPFETRCLESKVELRLLLQSTLDVLPISSTEFLRRMFSRNLVTPWNIPFGSLSSFSYEDNPMQQNLLNLQ